MKNEIFLIISFLISLNIFGKETDSSNSFIYLNQTPPESYPEIFAPGIISDAGFRLHSFPSFSPDGNEIYWSVIPPNVYFVKMNDGEWSQPEIADFSQKNIQAPFYSYDNKRIYFQLSGKNSYGSLDIWYVEKSANGWSVPINLGSPPNSQGKESQPTLTKNGDLYFISKVEGVAWEQGIFFSKLVNGKYEKPILLDSPINTEYIEAYPFISQDESFLIFSSSRPSKEEKDLKLFISFKGSDKKWENPINISERLGLNLPVRFGYISPDEKYLFFLMANKIYWVDAKILEELK